MAEQRTRKLEVIAQDPGVKRNGRILTTEVTVPWGQSNLKSTEDLRSSAEFWNDVEIEF